MDKNSTDWRSQQFFVTKNGKKELIHIETDTKNIVDFYTGVIAIINKLKAVANGLATLGPDGHVPQDQLNNIEQQLKDLEKRLTGNINNNNTVVNTNLANTVKELKDLISALDTKCEGAYVKKAGDTMTGALTSTVQSGTWVNGMKNAALNCNFNSYSAIANSPSKNGRFSLSSYPDQNNNFYISYMTQDKINADTNATDKQLIWSGDTGVLTCTKVVNSVYNDYAELFPKGEETEPGDLIVLDLDSKEEKYVKSNKNNTRVVGVHSDEYAHLIGGDNVSLEENLKNYIPVSLAGRVKVKFIGISKKNEYVVADTHNPGVARLYYKDLNKPEDIIGILVEEDSNTNPNEIRRLKIKLI